MVTRLLSFLFKIWMSRALGAEAVGVYQIAFSVLLLLFSFTAGAPTVLSRKVAECAARGDTKRQNALTTASLLIGLGSSVAICVLFLALSDHLGGLFADERCVPIFLIMLPALVTSSLYAPLRSWFWGRKNFLTFSSLELVDEVLKIGFAMLFAGGFFAALTGAAGVALALVLSDAVSVLVLFILFFKAGGRFAKRRGQKNSSPPPCPFPRCAYSLPFPPLFRRSSSPNNWLRAGCPSRSPRRSTAGWRVWRCLS